MSDSISNEKNNQVFINPTDQINWLATMMSIDNEVNEKEQKVVLDYGLKIGLKEEKIKRIISTALKEQETLYPYLKLSKLPRNDDFMRALIQVVIADEKIAKEELEFMRLAAKKMQYTNEEFQQIFTEEKDNYQSNYK